MILGKLDPISNTLIREKSVESVVDWFDHHKQSFYTLGWFYLKDQQQMEELFYRSIIKVQKDLPRFKSETSFDMWVTSIFIHTCWELSAARSLQASEESEHRRDLFKAFDRLKKDEKDAVVLTYVKGFSQEATAHLLQVSVERIKELLFSGIQSLKRLIGYETAFNGCKEYYKDYIDYLERTLERPQKINFEVHIFHCQDCQEDLAAFQDVMLTMVTLTERLENFHVPADFLETVKARLAEKENRRKLKIKKRVRMGIVIASVFALLIGMEIFTGAFTKLYYTYTEENQELRAFFQHGLGERLNLEAESNGVKISIKSVIADEVQTLVFYEIEDTVEDHQYVLNYFDGVTVNNLHEIMLRDTYKRYQPPDLESDLNNNEKNVYRGKISLLPLSKDKGTIKLKITKLQKLNRNTTGKLSFNNYENMEYKTGDWNFEIPVTKQPSANYALDSEIKVEGIAVRFEKLIMAPTATILQYSLNNELPNKRMDILNFSNLEVNSKKMNADRYGGPLYLQQISNWATFQSQFDPLFGEKPKKVKVQLDSARFSVEDNLTILLDASKEYPQTYQYAGSNLSIDKVEAGQPAHIVISNRDIENRAYESLRFQVMVNGEDLNLPMELDSEGVLVDKNGKKYDMNNVPVPFEEIEHPRFFFTVHHITMHSNTGDNVIPKRLEIYGYDSTKFLDDVVEITLK